VPPLLLFYEELWAPKDDKSTPQNRSRSVFDHFSFWLDSHVQALVKP
jgi:hypothetical protein